MKKPNSKIARSKAAQFETVVKRLFSPLMGCLPRLPCFSLSSLLQAAKLRLRAFIQQFSPELDEGALRQNASLDDLRRAFIWSVLDNSVREHLSNAMNGHQLIAGSCVQRFCGVVCFRHPAGDRGRSRGFL